MRIIGITITIFLAFGITVTSVSAEGIPEWVKSNAGWWANGDISESEFISGIQFLIKTGIISVSITETKNMQEESKNIKSESTSTDSKLVTLQAELDKCSEITRTYDRLTCERDVEHKINVYAYKQNSQAFEV